MGSVEAARAWLGTWGSADQAMVDVVDEARASGVRVALLTNGTDTIHDELAACGLAEAFDEVFCSWHLGVAKPDPEVYRRVCAAMAVDPSEVIFFDDSEPNVVGARSMGMIAEVFQSPDQIRRAIVSG